MAERTPFQIQWGSKQGRLKPSDFSVVTGDHAFVLGSTYAHEHEFSDGDYIEVYQNLSLSTANLLRFDARILQPAGMPVGRSLTNASLLRGLELNIYPAYLECASAETYDFSTNNVLTIKVDGGS